MDCNEIKERLVEVLYNENEPGKCSENDDLQAHLRTCSDCREELDRLKQTRDYLQIWKDEPPLRSTVIKKTPSRVSLGWSWVWRGAIAAMGIVCLLAISNAQIIWSKDGFYFSTSLFHVAKKERDYYTKKEFREILKQALDDSESRMTEINYLMMLKMLETIEQDRWVDLQLVRNSSPPKQNRN